MNQAKRASASTFTREEWLELAFNCIRQSGASVFRLDDLIKAMPVTKGSFYHHFKGKQDFLEALVNFWDVHYTQIVLHLLEESKGQLTAKERLHTLLKAVDSLDYGRLELLVRSLAQQDDDVASLVRKVDASRYRQVGELFEDLGFEGQEKDLRTHVFVVFMSCEDFLSKFDGATDRDEKIKARLEFFTRQ